MANIVPEKTQNFAVYIDGSDSAGVADGTFPNVEFMTSEVKGAGLAGAVDSPGVGQLQSLTCELNWRTRPRNFIALAEPRAHNLDFYADDLSYDAGRGEYVHTQVHIFMKAVTKSYDIGKLAVDESAESKTEHEIYYFKLEVDRKEVIVVDKYNYIYRVNGVDYLAETRRALGKM